MPLQIVRNDITKMAVDAIVNAAQPRLTGGGGVDGAIHAAAGPGLLAECETLGGCATGEAKITGAYDLPCKYVIHTVGPVWHGGLFGEQRKLASCYRASLELALEHGCESVAFPLISAGTYGYPKDKALRIAMDAIGEFLMLHELDVYLVVYSAQSMALGRALFADIQEYIDDNYVEDHATLYQRESVLYDDVLSPGAPEARGETCAAPSPAGAKPKAAMYPSHAAPQMRESEELDTLLRQVDESFQQMLLRKIDERGMTDAECYKKANIDRKLFSKIRGDVYYHPKKTTAAAFAVALELGWPETAELLGKAGYSLSHSSKFDIILEYFIRRGNYDIYEINEALFFYDQSLLGV